MGDYRHNKYYGELLKSYSVHCGICGLYFTFSTNESKNDVIIKLENSGWIESLNFGFICKKCILNNFKDVKFKNTVELNFWMEHHLTEITEQIVKNFDEQELKPQPVYDDDDIPF